MIAECDQIGEDLERICSSDEFAGSPRLVRLLRFCVEQSRLNQLDNLKESTIGVAVFDRDPGYNLKADPIVRVTAARLRRKLEEFYSSSNCHHNTVIEIPKGSYVAVFREETVPIAEIPADETHIAQSSAVVPLVVPARPFPTRPVLIALAAAILGAGLLLLWRYSGPLASAGRIEPLVALPGLAMDPAWSADGETLAFAWNGGTPQPPHIYMLKHGASVPVRLSAANQSESRPVWSPDGQAIALLRQTSANELSLVIARVDGTPAEKIIRRIAQPASAMNMTALDWSPDGKQLVSSEGSKSGGSRHLILISLADGSSKAITDPPIAATGDVEARFSPDGQKVAFRRGGEGTLFVLSLRGNGNWQPVQLTQMNSGVRGIAWSANGERIYFGSQQNRGYFSLWSIPADGGRPEQVTSGIEAISPALNSRKHLIAVTQQQIDQNLWLYSMDSARAPRILVPSTAVESAPAFAPDGKRFAFVSSRSGTLEVWVSGIDDLMPKRVSSLTDARVIGNLSWSTDGNSVVYSARREGKNGAWQTVIGSGVTTMLRESDSYTNWPQLSADGNSLYFISNADHEFRLWHQTGDRAAAAAPLLPELITSFRVSEEGRALYFLRQGAQTILTRMDAATKKTTPVYTLPLNAPEMSAWDVADGRFFYVALDASRCVARIVAVQLKDGTSRTLGEYPVPSVEHWQPAISSSADGRSVIVTRIDRDDATLLGVDLR